MNVFIVLPVSFEQSRLRRQIQSAIFGWEHLRQRRRKPGHNEVVCLQAGPGDSVMPGN